MSERESSGMTVMEALGVLAEVLGVLTFLVGIALPFSIILWGFALSVIRSLL